jgi:trigger factor
MVTISKEISRLEHSAIQLTLKVEKSEVRSEYDNILTDYCKTIQLPGFRKGKVPKAVLERKFGDALKGEAFSHLLEQVIVKTFEDETFPAEDRPLPYSSPQIQGEPAMDLDADLVFSVVYDVFPAIQLGQWKGLEAEIPEVIITDEDINRELETVRERNAIVLDKDDEAPAAKGDVVTVNYSELTDAGAVEAGTERQDFVFTIGSGHNVFKFDEDILGMKKGASKDIEKTYPEDFEDKDLAGKTKKIRVSLTALKEKKLPDLDDDFAQDVDEKYKTLEDLKTSIRDRLAKNLEERLQEFKNQRLLEKIMETTPVDLPESMIRFQLDSRWRNLARRMNIPVQDWPDVTQNPKGEMANLLEAWRPDTVKALHSRLIVETLIKDQGLAASEEDVAEQIKSIADKVGSPVEEIKAYYEKDNMEEYLKEEVKERKLFDLLLSENSFKVGDKKNYLEFIGNTQQPQG